MNNVFSVGLLARLFTATGETRYLDSAVKKADIGVLPGQMPGGRWFDAHNASAVYHNILMRDVLELHRALPELHAFRPALLDALTRGLNQAAEETLAHGFTGTWTDNFAHGLQWIGENIKWRDALNANVNAAAPRAATTRPLPQDDWSVPDAIRPPRRPGGFGFTHPPAPAAQQACKTR